MKTILIVIFYSYGILPGDNFSIETSGPWSSEEQCVSQGEYVKHDQYNAGLFKSIEYVCVGNR